MIRRSGVLDRINEALCGGLSEEEKKDAIASYAALDAQFDGIRTEIEAAGRKSPRKWKIPIR